VWNARRPRWLDPGRCDHEITGNRPLSAAA
jgi:hypothetical protein